MASTTPSLLSRSNAAALHAAQKSLRAPTAVGVVVSAGRMQRAVKVQTTRQKTDGYLRTRYTVHPTHLVSDPADSLRTGDVVRIAPWPKRGRIEHVVTEIVRPFGPPVDQRPPIPSLDELVARRQAKKDAKRGRKEARLAAAAEEAAAEEVGMDAETGEGRGHGREEPAAVAQDRNNTAAARKIDELKDQGVSMEVEAEEIERKAGEQGIDLKERTDGVRL